MACTTVGLFSLYKHVMTTNTESTGHIPTSGDEGPHATSSPPTTLDSSRYILPAEHRLRRVCGALEALSDALNGDGGEYGALLERRALALDLLNDELVSVTRQLEGGAA